MSLINIKRHIQAVRQNKGILATDQIQIESRAAVPTDSDLANGRIVYVGGTGLRMYVESTWYTIPTSTSGTSPNSWETLYLADKSMTINDTTLTFAGTHASNDVFTITNATGSGDCIQITNSGTGSDLKGTSNTWSVSKAGAAVFTALTGCDTLTAAANLAINATAAGTIAIGNVSTGGVTITPALTATASVTITGTADTSVLVVTAGDMTIGGSITITENDTSTYGLNVVSSGTTGGAIHATCNDLANGFMVVLDSDNESSFGTGGYFECYDGAAAVFTIAANGATVIAGDAGGTDALTITAGDIFLSDSDQNIIESENGTSTLLLLDNKAGAVGSGEAVLKVDAGGVVNAAGFGIYATFTGAAAAGATVIGVVPDAGSVGVKINGGSVDTREALYVDADPTAYDVAYIHTDGVIADNKAVLSLHSAGAMAAGSSILRLAQAGTPAAATAYTFEIDNTDSTTTNNAVAVRIDNHTSTGAVIQATSAGASAPLLDLYSTNAGATGVVLKTTHTSASPADDDVVASVQFWGVDDAGSEEFGRIETMIVDATSATSASAMKFYVDVAGTAETALTLKTNYAIVGGGGDTGYVTSNGAYNLVLNTNEGTDSGTITITDAANGDIIITPNGSGQTQLFAPALQVTNKTSAATLTIAEVGVITADTTSGAFSLTLPAAATSAGAMYKIIKTDAAANAVTIDGNGAELINGSATYAGIDAQYDTATVYCNGTAWFITESIIA